MAILTEIQINLLSKALNYTGPKNPIRYDTLKSLCIEEFKSFENTFNALLFKGYFESVETNDFSNQFRPTQKAVKSIVPSDFLTWIDSDNVIKTGPNTYKTQCTQYKTEYTKEELLNYFTREYL